MSTDWRGSHCLLAERWGVVGGGGGGGGRPVAEVTAGGAHLAGGAGLWKGADLAKVLNLGQSLVLSWRKVQSLMLSLVLTVRRC